MTNVGLTKNQRKVRVPLLLCATAKRSLSMSQHTQCNAHATTSPRLPASTSCFVLLWSSCFAPVSMCVKGRAMSRSDFCTLTTQLGAVRSFTDFHTQSATTESFFDALFQTESRWATQITSPAELFTCSLLLRCRGGRAHGGWKLNVVFVVGLRGLGLSAAQPLSTKLTEAFEPRSKSNCHKELRRINTRLTQNAKRILISN